MNESILKYSNYLKAQEKSNVYFNFIKIYITWLDNNKLSEQGIKQETITKFFIEHEYSINSKNNFIKACRDYYSNFLQLPKETNDWFKIKLIPIPQKEPDFLFEEDIEACIKFIGTYHTELMSSTKARAFFYFMFYTGLRKGELLNLKREDIHLDDGYILVRVPNKGKKERKAFFASDTKLKEKLIHYFETEPENNNAFNMTTGKLSYLCKILSENFHRKIYTHLLRHSAGRELSARGVDIQFIAKQFGHASTKTTQIYIKPDEKLTQRVINDAFRRNK